MQDRYEEIIFFRKAGSQGGRQENDENEEEKKRRKEGGREVGAEGRAEGGWKSSARKGSGQIGAVGQKKLEESGEGERQG